ncbi:hypothetical protein AZI87_11510 [Bdellovibrio bacteriovorus]|uniref:FecR protein domain-containing protein n=1 Tax=Bdellovibrio bacteriovorus TaxID=959 RepID=A0A161PBT1_BDEBC|nr:hypothetical protein [Bdellovibrio bacteriovorus]KYG65186.1 hypothetical protein AZI87_11510 [Bdellovibrio bacteriovorus]
MKKFFRVLIFIMAFQMEVRVRASGDVLQQPSECLKSKETCALQVTGKALHYSSESLKIHAKDGSTLVRLAPDQWRFVNGAVWMEKSKNVELETLYGTLKATQGQYFVVDQGNKVLVRNMDATLTVTLRDGKTLSLPEGFEFWISGVNSKGQTDYGMIQPVDMKSHLPLWNLMYEGSKKDFIAMVSHLRENWGDLTEKSALIYKNVVEREIASEKQKERAEQVRKARIEAERQEMKRLYHQRVFER